MAYRKQKIIKTNNVQSKSNIKYGTVLGGGAFGTAMAQVLARNGVQVTMWVLEKEVKDAINTMNMNTVFLKDINLHPNIKATNDFDEALKDTEIIMVVIPTPFLREVVCARNTSLPVGVPLVCCTKGIENETLLTPFEILTEELPGKYHDYLAAVSGPSFAAEVAVGMPTSVLCASNVPEVGETVQQVMSSPDFRVFTGDDVIGAEICGAMKNVIAIACGASNGLGFGHDTMALLITRGLGEITKLAIMKGAHPSTMSGLAGLGDLVLTCTSTMSRNFTVGTRIAKGETMAEIGKSMKSVAEGVKTSKSVHVMAGQLGVHLPLCEEVYKVLWEDKDLSLALADLGKLPLEPEFNPYEHYNEIKNIQKAKL